MQLLLKMFIYIFISGCTSVRYTSCDVCKKKYTSESTLLKHRMWHHKEMCPSFKYNCDSCPYSTDIITHFKRHAPVHDPKRPFQCKICNNRFTAMSSLNCHMLIHSGEQAVYFGVPFTN